MKPNLPIFYSFRRCPFAMRARLALYISGAEYEHREILLRDKPPSMLRASSKGTVPVLVNGAQVIDESFDIMLWALQQNDPEQWLPCERAQKPAVFALIAAADDEFKKNLDIYKYQSRHGAGAGDVARDKGVTFLMGLDERLKTHGFLFGKTRGLADMAIFPFVRQFANVKRGWFDGLNFSELHTWLTHHEESDLFEAIMDKHPLWLEV